MEDYFCLDAILASEPRVYTRFLVPGRTLAHLDPLQAALLTSSTPEAEAKPTDDLPSGSRVALPFWLAESLTERSVTSIELPRVYGSSTVAELRADAPSVSLRGRCDAYFDLGVRLARLLRAPRLPGVLLSAYAGRCWGAVDAGAHAHAPVLGKLERGERKLFFAARAVARGERRWKERRVGRIRTAVVPVKRAAAAGNTAGVLGKRGADTIGMSPVTPRAGSRARVR